MILWLRSAGAEDAMLVAAICVLHAIFALTSQVVANSPARAIFIEPALFCLVDAFAD
jgi:hypothetical protein